MNVLYMVMFHVCARDCIWVLCTMGVCCAGLSVYVCLWGFRCVCVDSLELMRCCMHDMVCVGVCESGRGCAAVCVKCCLVGDTCVIVCL